MVTSSIQSNSAISDTDSRSTSSQTTSNPFMAVNAYQEEMCEKLIQLSFVKIVSSKSERGGARLRKNLLILHLLQKARMEQRNRLLSSRNSMMSVNQQPEVVAKQLAMSESNVENGNEHREHHQSNIGHEKIDSAYLSQQEMNDDQTSTGTNGELGNVQDCQVISDHVTISEENGRSEPGTSKDFTSFDQISNISKRASIKRKRDSSDCELLSIDYNNSPKMACTLHHPSIDQPQQQESPNLNELLSAIKSAALAKPSEENEGDKRMEEMSPLSRSLSCSSLMELTCES